MPVEINGEQRDRHADTRSQLQALAAAVLAWEEASRAVRHVENIASGAQAEDAEQVARAHMIQLAKEYNDEQG